MLQQKEFNEWKLWKDVAVIFQNLDLFCKIKKYKFWFNSFFIN